jgi:1,4-alpha-glucan branching enzyme
MKKSAPNEKKKIEFTFKSAPGREVFIAGTFNAWDPSKTKLTERDAGLYRVSIKLPPGRHEYKFVVDGCWQTDPENPSGLLNDFGDLNSVITVN